MVNQSERGEYNKYVVERTDKRDAKSGDRINAEYLVLDLTYDKHTWPALKAYADAVRPNYPKFAKDLDLRYAIKHTQYPFIWKACFLITLDNGGLNRERAKATVFEEYEAFISGIEENETWSLKAIDNWIGSLTFNNNPAIETQIETLCAGEDTEREELLLGSPAGTDDLLNKWFEGPC